jgi:mRNA interferase RelE/StbE
MKIYQSRSFERKVKKTDEDRKGLVGWGNKENCGRSEHREEKKGDLRGVFVHKFKVKVTEYQVAYRKVGGDLELIMLGSHEIRPPMSSAHISPHGIARNDRPPREFRRSVKTEDDLRGRLLYHKVWRLAK